VQLTAASSAAAGDVAGQPTPVSIEFHAWISVSLNVCCKYKIKPNKHHSFSTNVALQEEAHASPAFQRTRFLAFAIMVTGCELPFVLLLLAVDVSIICNCKGLNPMLACRCQLLSHKELPELCHSCDDARQGFGFDLHPDWRADQYSACLLWYSTLANTDMCITQCTHPAVHHL